MEPQFRIEELEARNARFLLYIYAPWERYTRLNIIYKICSKFRQLPGEQMPKKQPCRLDIARVRLLRNDRARNVFVVNKKRFSKVPSAVSCYSSGIANAFETRLENVLAQ